MCRRINLGWFNAVQIVDDHKCLWRNAQYGNKDDTGEPLTKVEMLSARALQMVRNVHSLLGSKRDHFMATLCDTRGKTAHFRVPHTAVASKAKCNGIYEKFQQINKEKLDFRG